MAQATADESTDWAVAIPPPQGEGRRSRGGGNRVDVVGICYSMADGTLVDCMIAPFRCKVF